ncbi:CU044_2847 family protein [Solwaraspora sp. WMMD406]|uniref:CU044_2847 family protein n=1 Tax=Solwaraspora sp. WMMD406 TaxID=3016095 RepID=UPI00241687CB|nr:CU044_2847 family protein [Solwaraspora sp. WMMD406]MDG4767820.1 CU044_2847 family protein [Solwaraspora sp. WMMD406]
MSKPIKVRLPSGEVVWTLADVPGRPTDVGFLDDRIHDVEGLTETIRGIGASVRQGLADLAPDTVTVQFGLTLTARTGRVISVLAEAGGQANLTVTLGWGPGGETGVAVEPAASGGPGDAEQPGSPGGSVEPTVGGELG